MRRLFVSLLFLILGPLGFFACSKPAGPAGADSATPANREYPVAAIDVCSLLTADEIQKVIGEKPNATTPSEMQSGGLTHSQCLFTQPTYSNSIALSVTRRGEGPQARDPREYWENKIQHPEEREPEGETGQRSELEPVPGIGEKAVWEGTGVGGALYILKGDAFVRIAVGTFGGNEKRKEKVIELARLVMERL